jgi:hypothetical protein
MHVKHDSAGNTTNEKHYDETKSRDHTGQKQPKSSAICRVLDYQSIECVKKYYDWNDQQKHNKSFMKSQPLARLATSWRLERLW